MPDLLERDEARISFGLDGFTPSATLPPVVGAVVGPGLYFGAEPTHGCLRWPGPRPGAWLSELAGRISHLSSLPPGWDGHRGRPIDRRILLQVWNFVERLAEFVAVAPSVVPTVSGGVALEWHRNGVDLEIEFYDGSARVFYEDAQGNESEGPLDQSAGVIAAALVQVR